MSIENGYIPTDEELKAEGFLNLGEIMQELFGEKEDPTQPEAAQVDTRSPRAYPPTDIGVDSQGVLFIDVALAGFRKEDITIKRKKNRVHVIGHCGAVEELIEEYYEQNISQDDFERILVVDEKYIEGQLIASMQDGILTIMIAPTVACDYETITIR